MEASITKTEAALPWPDDPPVLAEHNIILWGDEPERNRRDLFWWLDHTFVINVGSAWRCEEVATRVLRDVIEERIGESIEDVWSFVSATRRTKTSKAWLAACWNEMLHRLVYDIPKANRKDPGRKA